MSDDAYALQDAVKARLAADATLTSLIGAGRIHDGPPRNAPLPFVALDEIRSRPIAPGLVEHRLTLRCWSKAGGKSEAAAAADRIDVLLAATPPVPAGTTLVSFALSSRDLRAGRDRASVVATLEFRAVTQA
jgi:hypothetical protein